VLEVGTSQLSLFVFSKNYLTMAAALAYNNYLTNTLLIASNDYQLSLIAQDLHTFGDYIALTEDNISDICTNVRKPGGTVNNPNHDPVNPVKGVPAAIPNHGIPIGHLIKKRLKMLQYYFFHLNRIQRPFNVPGAALLTLSACYKLQEQHKLEEDTKTELPGKVTNIDKIRQFLEYIDNYMSLVRGANGLPLLYVVRESAALPEVDPGYGIPTFDA
jgi:hypothetical protein